MTFLKKKKAEPATLKSYLQKLIASFEQSQPDYQKNRTYQHAVQVLERGKDDEIAGLYLDLLRHNWTNKALSESDEQGMVTMLELLAEYRKNRGVGA